MATYQELHDTIDTLQVLYDAATTDAEESQYAGAIGLIEAKITMMTARDIGKIDVLEERIAVLKNLLVSPRKRKREEE